MPQDGRFGSSQIILHAIERAALRHRKIPKDNLVGQLDVILEEFANILAAYGDYQRAVIETAKRTAPEPEEPHCPKPTVLN